MTKVNHRQQIPRIVGVTIPSGQRVVVEDGRRDRTCPVGEDLKSYYNHGETGRVKNNESTCLTGDPRGLLLSTDHKGSTSIVRVN